VKLLYPLTLLVTFLHEMSHAFAALLSGGQVLSLQVNPDGGGLCTTQGGNPLLVTAAGYLGSVVFGNLLLRIGLRWAKLAPVVLMCLALFMVTVSFVWYGGTFSFLFTLAFGLLLALLAWKLPRVGRGFLVVAGIYSVLYVIRDFNVGPSSDLMAFSKMALLPAGIWMYLWLIFAVMITLANVYFLFRRKRS